MAKSWHKKNRLKKELGWHVFFLFSLLVSLPDISHLFTILTSPFRTPTQSQSPLKPLVTSEYPPSNLVSVKSRSTHAHPRQAAHSPTHSNIHGTPRNTRRPPDLSRISLRVSENDDANQVTTRSHNLYGQFFQDMNGKMVYFSFEVDALWLMNFSKSSLITIRLTIIFLSFSRSPANPSTFPQG